MRDLICVGGAIVDAFLSIPPDSIHYHVTDHKRELSFPLGQKIVLEDASFQLGGNACNVAVGTKRLGLRVSLMAEIGKDEFANKILHNLAQENVDTTHIIQTNTQSSFAVGINVRGDRTLFVKHRTRSHTFSYEDVDTKWVYLTSLGNKWEHAYETVGRLVTERGVRLACNPGTLQLQAGLDHLKPLFAKTTMLLLNRDEAKKLLGKDEPVKTLLADLQALGPEEVVITDGDNGAYTISFTKDMYHLPILSRPIVERTGAGDAFASGYLAARIHDKPIIEAMQWGGLNAASVIGKVGAQPGLLAHEEMESHMRKYKHDLVVKEIN